jgi:hypothetical protein
MIGFAELAERFRRGVEGASDAELPPLRPPASTTAIAAAEVELGFRLPDDIRELWSVADGGLVFGREFLWVEQFGEFTRTAMDSWEEALDEFISEDSPFGLRPGDVPQGGFVLIGGGYDAVIWAQEVDGPQTGRIVRFDMSYMSEPAWRTYAPSLEAILRFYVDLAEEGHFELQYNEVSKRARPFLRKDRRAEALEIEARHGVTHVVAETIGLQDP